MLLALAIATWFAGFMAALTLWAGVRPRVGVMGFVLALTWPAALLATVVLLAAYLADERLERPRSERGPLRRKSGVP